MNTRARARNVSRIAVSTGGDGTPGVDGKDGGVVAIIDICKSLGRCILHVQVVYIATRRVFAGKE